MKRKQLTLECGFNEKGYSFLTEDTYFSIKDDYDLLDIKNNYLKELENNLAGLTDLYGCVLKTSNQFKNKNRLSNFTCHIKIHLVKILDIRIDIRSL